MGASAVELLAKVPRLRASRYGPVFVNQFGHETPPRLCVTLYGFGLCERDSNEQMRDAICFRRA